MRGTSMEVTEPKKKKCNLGPSITPAVEVKNVCLFVCCETAPEVMENPGYCSGSFDGLYHPSDDDDDEMVDIAGATLDFSTTDDDPPLSSGKTAQVSRAPH